MDFLTPESAENLDLVRQILEQGGLEPVRNIVRLPSGSRSVAYFADDYVVRFPKALVIWQTMQREKEIVDKVEPYLLPYFAGRIGKIELADGKYPFSFSRRLYGKICDGRPESEFAVQYHNLSVRQQEKLAQEIAVFFNLMHGVDYAKLEIPAATEAIDSWDVTAREDFEVEIVRQILLRHGIDLRDYVPEKRNEVKALCHNDLSGSNILLKSDEDDVLAGIIDFGNVMVMPKYQDFFPLYKIQRKLAVDTLKYYNEITDSPIEQKQIDYMALAYIGYGLAQNPGSPSSYSMRLLKLFL